MTTSSSRPASNVTTRAGNAALDCNGAQVRAQCRHLATVVAISGRIDTTNIGCITEHATRFVLAAKPIVLDLSSVDSIAAQCTSLFYAVDDTCGTAAVEWSLVASPAVTHLLRFSDDLDGIPVVGSVAEALHHFADEIRSRRRRLMPLLAKTA